ncbi:MAG: glycosyltransferase [Lactobacillales bacterium]|jgi:glycosyltransferase involved in cell wall biosynthesis|nr:glycosyltransferase [Lactobacillales bacterium]
MPKPAPKISVIMPAYNAEAYIDAAIQSICAQTYSHWELIVVNDASTDRTAKIIARWCLQDKRIKTITLKHHAGASSARNTGILTAQSQYIVSMDADDVSLKDRFAKQIKFMETHSQVAILGGSMQVCDQNLKPLNLRHYHLTDQQIRQHLFRYSPFSHPTIFYRKDLAIKAGLYNSNLDRAEDYDFYFRLAKLGQLANLPDVIHNMRITKTGLSYSNTRRQEKLTLFVRLKAVFEYGYQMTIFDQLYFCAQLLSLFVIPSKVKYFLFNFLRSRKI